MKLPKRTKKIKEDDGRGPPVKQELQAGEIDPESLVKLLHSMFPLEKFEVDVGKACAPVSSHSPLTCMALDYTRYL
jgi:hypothetical protein